jgi:DNA-binding MarR family transcriptional regulator
MDVLRQFRSVLNATRQYFQQVEEVRHISGAQLWALAVVVRQPGLRVSDLARSMGIHQSTASNLIDRLVESEMLRKTRSEQDQRVVHLTPTPEGLALIGRAPQPLEGRLPEALRQMAPEDLASLHVLLGKLLSILNTQEAAGVSLTEIVKPSLTPSQGFAVEKTLSP